MIVTSKEESRKEELDIIKKSISNFFVLTIKAYVAYRMRAIAQFSKLKKGN